MMEIHKGPAIWDGAWSLLCHDKETGDTVWFIDDGEKLTFRTTQDIERTLENNKILRDGTEGRAFGDYRLIASVPDNIAQDSGLDAAWVQKDKKFIKRFFNDADNARLRASRGMV